MTAPPHERAYSTASSLLGRRRDSRAAERRNDATRTVVGAFGLYAVLAVAGILLTRLTGHAPTVWPANAVLIALMFRDRDLNVAALLFGAAVGGFATALAFGAPPTAAGALTAADILEISVAAWLIDRLPFDRGAAMIELPVLAVAGIAAPFVAALGAGLCGFGHDGAGGFWTVFWGWWSGSALGAVIVMPIVFAADAKAIARTFGGRRGLEFGIVASTCLILSFYLSTVSQAPMVLICVVLMLAAVRLDRFAMAILSAACAILVLMAMGFADPDADGGDGPSRNLPVWLALVAPFFVALTLDQHRRGQSSLVESERRFRGAMDNAAIGMTLVTSDGRLTRVNRALCDMLGYTADELTRMNFAQFTHPEDLSKDLAQVDRLLRNEADSYFLEKRYIRADGKAVWGHLAVSAMRDEDGRVVQFISQIENIDQRKRAEEALAVSESRWNFALESARHGVWDRDITAGRTYYSPVWKAMLGYGDDEISDSSAEWTRLIHPDDKAHAEELDAACIDGGVDGFECEFRMRHRDGRWIWILDRGRVVARNADGRARRMIGTHVDISAQKRSEDDLRALTAALFEEKERLRITLCSIGDAVICTDTDANITFMNPVAEAMTGWTLGEAVGRPVHDIFDVVDPMGNHPPCAVRACLRDLVPYYMRDDTSLTTRDGKRLTVRDSAAPIRDVEGRLIGAVLVFQDVTPARTLQNELAQSALIDPLTGLPNRKALEQRLAEADEMVRLGRRRISLCFIDLDRFKILNDSAGHAAGNALLVAVAEAIRANIRPGDEVHRLGGDEFAILMECPLDEAEQIGKAVIRAVAALPFAWEGRGFALTASAGIAEIPVEGIAVGELMSRADVACYTAKSTGRNRVSLYRPEESEAGRYHRDIQIASGIRSAIAEDRFRIFAQRITYLQDGGDGTRRYFEILLRLEDENGEMMFPGAFIPAAERYDLMGEIDRWVIQTTLRRYGPRLRALGDFSLAINLSANSLNDPNLWPFVRAELEASGIEPRRLNFEITETALIDNLEAASEFVASVRAIGCGITLDDFGAGLSSFSYLRRFPVDQLKIDGNFVRQIVNSPVDRAIVESINDLGHKFGARTIAEFVEDQATLDLLRDLGVDMAQGYTIARPVPIEDILPDIA
ncbi:EAL domain-containing protein [Zavarzinia compransoris]|uniref:EAL domain-containing protein n=1 Tax=Zavarzinia marina TaxID=2911065 RepID=UPI001F44F32F|nr:EAL domain-containing protein [Zavarzinia marina]MCF4164062.1 EAL domain-containing protein [Zavarzinia marina]